MAIDTSAETLITLAEARSAFPGRKRLGLATLHRWRLRGVRGVKLETVLVGGLRYTSREAIERFVAAQNATAVESSGLTAAQRNRQAQAAQRALRDIIG